MLELTEQKAKDLNEIVAKTLEKEQNHSDGFELQWFIRRVRTDLTDDYCNSPIFINEVFQ